jgi:uncharacterized protein YbaA (DUF1428 family)
MINENPRTPTEGWGILYVKEGTVHVVATYSRQADAEANAASLRRKIKKGCATGTLTVFSWAKYQERQKQEAVA